MASRHKRAALEGQLEVFIKAGVAAAAMTLTTASGGIMEDADISFTNTATGSYTITVNPFKLPAGEAYAFAQALHATLKLYTVVKSITYTNDSLAVALLFFDEGGVAQDPTSVFLHLFAC